MENRTQSSTIPTNYLAGIPNRRPGDFNFKHPRTRSSRSFQVLNAFTVDVEDYFQVTAFEEDIPRSSWPDYSSRVVENTQRLLDLLAQHRVRGTFFILGWVAEKFPQLVREIHAAGHEVGSHSYWHRLVYQQTPGEFRKDLRRSRDVLTDILGEDVTCYRAPTFSITGRSWWALEILVEEGFTVDSSIFPVRHDRYGVPDGNPDIHEIETASGPITEFPPSTYRCLGRNLPVAGGGYFRLMPLHWTLHCVLRINEDASRPFMFYTHPWEIDGRQPKLSAGTRLSRFRHRVNLNHTAGRLHQLLARFPFGRMDHVIVAHTESAPATLPPVEPTSASALS